MAKLSKDQKRARRLKKDAERAKKKPVCDLCKIEGSELIQKTDPRHAERHAANLIKHADFVRSIYRKKSLAEPICRDCGLDTLGDEYFWTIDSVWQVVNAEIILCVGCLEKRIGRELRPDDFDFDQPGAILVNADPWFPRSARLKSRMGLPEGSENATILPPIYVRALKDF